MAIEVRVVGFDRTRVSRGCTIKSCRRHVQSVLANPFLKKKKNVLFLFMYFNLNPDVSLERRFSIPAKDDIL